MSRGWLLAAWLGVSAVAASGCASFNELTEADLTDPAIKARILHRLKGEEGLNVAKVELDVHIGVVTVSGMVDSYEARERVVYVARRTRGVRHVVANLIVEQ